MISPAPQRWVLATGNAGKVRELTALLADTPMIFVALSEFDVAPAAETGATFIENALIKARHAARLTGLPALADDSGLAVDALGGAPGVRSARYAGPEATDEENVAKLLRDLEELPAGQRDARFHCAIVALRFADDPAPLVAHASWSGAIAIEPAGTGGFGYDPVFIDASTGKTAAELPAEAKNRLSHRARALAAIREQLLTPDRRSRPDR